MVKQPRFIKYRRVSRLAKYIKRAYARMSKETKFRLQLLAIQFNMEDYEDVRTNVLQNKNI